jgi:tRNA 2-thiouridine synthesizing protein C
MQNEMMRSKRILFLLRQPPYATSHALEALEAALVAGVFDQQVTALFCDDGVWQLITGQDGTALDARTLGKVAQALPEYGIEALYVCRESLTARHLSLDDLVLPATPLDAAEQTALLGSQDVVVND